MAERAVARSLSPGRGGARSFELSLDGRRDKDQREKFTKPRQETNYDDVMLLCEVGSDASFRDISRFGDPENKGATSYCKPRISTRRNTYFAYCYNLGVLSRVICGGGSSRGSQSSTGGDQDDEGG
jgi:hypothetical protein